MSTVNRDLQKMEFTLKEAEMAAFDTYEWRRSVAHCVQLDER